MGFDKDRRPIWMPGRRDKLTTISSTATVIPSYGYNLLGASTVAGTKLFKMANPLPLSGSGGIEVNILTPNIIKGSSAKKHIVPQSTRTSFVFGTTKSYHKLSFDMTTGSSQHRGASIRMISLSTSKYYIISKSTSISLSTSST